MPENLKSKNESHGMERYHSVAFVGSELLISELTAPIPQNFQRGVAFGCAVKRGDAQCVGLVGLQLFCRKRKG